MSISVEQAAALVADVSAAAEAIAAANAAAAAAAADPASNKRKLEDSEALPDAKLAKLTATALPQKLETSVAKNTKAREVRLEQNRKAARESRRRKKVMIEELQRSVIFFSRANGALKQQNDELTRLLMQAQMQASAQENATTNAENKKEDVQEKKLLKAEAMAIVNQTQAAATVAAPPSPPVVAAPAPVQAPPAPVAAAPAVQAPAPVAPVPQEDSQATQQAQANAVATQAMLETQGFPAAAARAAAQTMNAGATTQLPGMVVSPASLKAPPTAAALGALPTMQPGSSMQAMANFQQAAAAAMQNAMGQLQGAVPGVDVGQLGAVAPPPAGASAQQSYTDAMTAIAMQQAAAQQLGVQPALSYLQPLMSAWQQQAAQQQQQQAQAVAAAPPDEAAPTATPTVVTTAATTTTTTTEAPVAAKQV